MVAAGPVAVRSNRRPPFLHSARGAERVSQCARLLPLACLLVLAIPAAPASAQSIWTPVATPNAEEISAIEYRDAFLRYATSSGKIYKRRVSVRRKRVKQAKRLKVVLIFLPTEGRDLV